MKVNVVGIEEKKGVGKKSGKEFDAYILYIEHLKNGVTGLCATDAFVDKPLLSELVKSVGDFKQLVGKNLDLDYDGRGYLVGASLLTK